MVKSAHFTAIRPGIRVLAYIPHLASPTPVTAALKGDKDGGLPGFTGFSLAEKMQMPDSGRNLASEE